jgi:hypothetical protein
MRSNAIQNTNKSLGDEEKLSQRGKNVSKEEIYKPLIIFTNTNHNSFIINVVSLKIIYAKRI